ncbi:MAG TPA: hypothetical protein VFL71_03260 [Actinomycetes bacterium]|nr:hypothetical protein [Actinomycetes bacterium]
MLVVDSLVLVVDSLVLVLDALVLLLGLVVVVVDPLVLVVDPLVLVGSVVEVLVVLDVVVLVVVVVVPAGQPVTQKTLCLTSAPREPSALIVSFTWKPWLGWGSMLPKSSV